ncbi:hypothetical protein ACFLTK_00120, partial [Chloroflexota bacterium]
SWELVKIYDIKPEAMSALKEEMGGELPVRITPTASAKEAVEGADIILMVTVARQLVVLEPWVEKGSFVACLNGYFDLDPMLSKRADKWVMGIRQGDTELVIELPAIGDGATLKELSRDDVYADMGEIVTGKKEGRENDQERIVYTHFGMGAHDIILAQTVYNRAIEEGKGIKIPLISTSSKWLLFLRSTF